MSIKNIICLLMIAGLVSCSVLQQVANNQQGGNNGNIQLDGPVNCDHTGRYVDLVFPKNTIKVFKDIPYTTMSKEDQWKGGDNSLCFGDREYKYPTDNGMEEMRMDIYMPDPKVDLCQDKPLIMFYHGGGFSPFGTFSKTTPIIVESSFYLAQLGYTVATIDYRKGYDFSNNTYHPDAISGQSDIMKNIDCRQGALPDPKTFQVALFRFIQDIRAAHRFLHVNADKIGVNPNKVFYMGTSTGAIGTAHAAYAKDETEHWSKYSGDKVADFGNYPELETEIKIAGVVNAQAGIHNVDWVEASDNIPTYMIHGESDRDVPYIDGRLAGLQKFDGSHDKANYFRLMGSKAIYDKIKSLPAQTDMNAVLVGFDGITHNIRPVMEGQCADLKGAGLKGKVWKGAYQFMNNICLAVDNGGRYEFDNKYCLYQNPGKNNCTPDCD